jgi:hypothetical protein
VPENGRPPKAELVEWVQALRGEGWLWRQIARELEISTAYAGQLYKDPTGEKDKARKASYGGTCERCGARTDGSNGRELAPKLCAACTVKAQHEERYWTAERIVETFQAFERIAGRPPAALDTGLGEAPSIRKRQSAARNAEGDRLRKLIRLPHPFTVQREWGSWNEALKAAGFPPNPMGGRGHRKR